MYQNFITLKKDYRKTVTKDYLKGTEDFEIKYTKFR